MLLRSFCYYYRDNVMKKKNVLIVGAGYMAKEYAKVLKVLNSEMIVVGRGEESAKTFQNETGVKVIIGGIDLYLEEAKELPEYAIVAVRSKDLEDCSIKLLKSGIRNLLIEKPGALRKEGIERIYSLSKEKNANCYIAYNRRFYASVQTAKRMIADDGGVTSFSFEFTEWPKTVLAAIKDSEERNQIMLNNSSHVMDMAFFLGGRPKELCSYQSGALDWHRYGAAFAGAGVSDKGALFSYQANYNAPGRWGAEILTAKHRYIFRPLEKLQIQEMNSVKITEVEIDDAIDIAYKPGLYKEVEAFLSQNPSSTDLCTIEEQCMDFTYYYQIRGDEV